MTTRGVSPRQWAPLCRRFRPPLAAGQVIAFKALDENDTVYYGLLQIKAFTGGTNYNRLQLGISAVANTPELSTWAMLVLGLALVGVGKRRRKLDSGQ